MAAAATMAYPVRDSFQSFPQQYSLYQTRAHQAAGEVQLALNVNPYANFAPASQQPQLQHSHSQSTRSSGSPASEDGSRPSLPSISNLLGIADGDRNAQENEVKQQSAQQVQPQHVQLDSRSQSQYASHELSSGQRTAIPPTPPLRNDSVVDHIHSPSTISTGSSLSAQPYHVSLAAGLALNNMDAEQQRMAQMNFMKRHSLPSQPNTSPYGTSPYQTSPYNTSPGGVSNGSYYSPTDPSYQVNQIYQRPLPSNFPPPQPVQPAQAMPTNKLWEHHHYISASSQATFPQSQDRYICQTCNKAFSRPSSLKIHSHSHTGEKPFKCPHAGCGKAFSVRSNMKRHERGCHTGASGLVNSHLN